MTDVPEAGLRERKKAATRQALAEHALALFAERGFDQVTVEDVARAVGVSPRTAFRYVDGKDDLLFVGDESIAELVTAAVTAQPPSPDPFDDVRAATAAFAAWCAPQRRVLRERDRVISASPALRTRDLAKRLAMTDALTALLAARHGLDAGKDLRPRTWATLGLGCMDAAYRHWLARGGDLQRHVDDAFAAATGG